MKKAIPIVIIVVCIIIGLILTREKPDSIPVPDEIIVHNGDVTLIMERANVPEQNRIFNKFTRLVNKRITEDVSTAQDVVDNEQIYIMKKNPLWIEFRYKDKYKMDIEGDNFESFEYTNLFFLLESSDGKTDISSAVNTMQHGKKSVFEDSSRGSLKYSKELVDYAKTFKTAKNFSKK